MLETGRGKLAGPPIESHADDFPPASLAPQPPQPQSNKEYEPQGDPKGMLDLLT
jgi:hypothetical protein